jgi:hypothetical protein
MGAGAGVGSLDALFLWIRFHCVFLVKTRCIAVLVFLVFWYSILFMAMVSSGLREWRLYHMGTGDEEYG